MGKNKRAGYSMPSDMKVMSDGYTARRLAYSLLIKITPIISYTVTPFEFSYRLDMANAYIDSLIPINEYLLSYEY